VTRTPRKQHEKAGAGDIDQDARERFRDIINAIRLHQLAIAKRLGCTAAYVSQIKTGLCPLAGSFAQKVEQEFGISARWLMSGEGRLIADRRKAVQEVDFGALPKEYLSSYDVYLARCGLDGIQGVTGIPLLERLTDDPPEALTEFTGASFHLPQPGVGALYTVKADPRWGAMFRRDELLLIEQRRPGEWAVRELKGKAAVLRRSPTQPLELYEIQVVGPGRPGEVELTSAAAPNSPPVAVELHQIEVFGVVLVAFRTSVGISRLSPTQLKLFNKPDGSKPDAKD